MAFKTRDPRLIWIDIETTGLDARFDQILEVAIVITDINGNQATEPRSWNIKFDHIDFYELGAKKWVRDTHEKNGLWEATKNGVPPAQFEAEALAYIDEHGASGIKKNIPAGNTIRFDLAFLEFRYPNITKRINHRSVDCSSFSITHDALGLPSDARPKKKYEHTALSDILESIEEYKWYTEIFRHGSGAITALTTDHQEALQQEEN